MHPSCLGRATLEENARAPMYNFERVRGTRTLWLREGPEDPVDTDMTGQFKRKDSTQSEARVGHVLCRVLLMRVCAGHRMRRTAWDVFCDRQCPGRLDV